MKRGIVAFSLIALVALAGTAVATDTATVDISATVVGTCEFNSAGTAIAFGTLPFTPLGTAAGAAANGSLTFQCTSGAVFAITDDDGQNETAVDANRMVGTLFPAEHIAYTLAYAPSSATGLGYGVPITLTMTATIPAGAYTTNTPDTYSDTVTLTITP